MTNRLLFFLIGASLLLTAVWLVFGEMLPPDSLAYAVCSRGLQFAQYGGLALLVRNGTLRSAPHLRFIGLSISLLLLGSLFKIEHWTGADVLLLGALAGVATTYSSWFSTKQPKTRLDLLKLLWVLAVTAGATAVLMRWAPREVLHFSNVLLWLAVLDFVYANSKRV